MERIVAQPRSNWQEQCENVGFSFHSLPSGDGQPYWNEGVTYRFSPAEIHDLETATDELFTRCQEAADHVVKKRRYAEFGIPSRFWDMVGESWEADDPNVYQRFDLAYDGNGPPQMLEINGDTPTSLVETAAQWNWLRDVMGPNSDQFNSVHEKLIEQWRFVGETWGLSKGSRLHLACLSGTDEDFDNIAYMAETARKAGLDPKLLAIEEIGWDIKAKRFVDAEFEHIEHIFKLYPWEWIMANPFGEHLLTTREETKWVEPMWKTLLSNKQLLVVMHELFPNHPNVLPAYNNPEPFRTNGIPYVRKPRLGREGANVQIYDRNGFLIEQAGGEYGEEGYVYQRMARLAQHAGHTAIVGSWVIGNEPAGIGIRETCGLITGDNAQFLPHYIA